MWFFAIPLMLKGDLAQQRKVQSADFFSQALLQQQKVAQSYCLEHGTLSAPKCGYVFRTEISNTLLVDYLNPAQQHSWLFTSGVLHSVWDGTRILSYLDMDALKTRNAFINGLQPGNVRAHWVSVSAEHGAAGLYSTATHSIRTWDNRSIPVSLPSVADGQPIIAVPD